MPIPRREPPPLLLVLHGCDVCEDANPERLYVTTLHGRLCSACWKAIGRPFDPPYLAPEQVHETQLAVKQRMLKRGGKDAYLVKAGKA